MRLLILGAGAIGGYFGARLVAAGADVTFLVRPRRAGQLAADGLVVLSPMGDERVPVSTILMAKPGFDAVLLTCKAFDLDAAMDAIAPAVGATTLIVPLLNGMAHLDALDARFGREKVLGGVAYIGTTLTEAGEIRHLNRLHGLTVGARRPEQQEGAAAVHATLARGAFDAVLSEDVLQAMWEKWVMITTYAGMNCLMRAPIGAIMAADDGEALMRTLLDECAVVAREQGHAPRPGFLDRTSRMLTEVGSTGTASMLRDLQRGAHTEHDHIVGDMLARARVAGVDAPVLRIARAHLQAYEAMRSANLSKEPSVPVQPSS